MPGKLSPLLMTAARVGLPLFLLAACAPVATAFESPVVTRDPDDLLQPSFAGQVPETELFIGIALLEDGTSVVAYICDSDPAMVGRRGAVGEWFKGTVQEDGTFDLVSSGNVRLKAAVQGESIRGTIEFPSAPALHFEAQRVDSPARLYREEGTNYIIGWVVLPDGSARGVSYPPYIRCPVGMEPSIKLAGLGVVGPAGICPPR